MTTPGRVLLVEDDPMLSTAYARALGADGFEVTPVQSGEGALSALSEADYDVLILDIGLPGIDGFAVLARLRGRDRALPVVVLTARDDADCRHRAFGLGADAFLGKPIALSELKRHVHAALRRVDAAGSPKTTCGPLVVDMEAGRAFLGGVPLDLPRREWSLLRLLIAQGGRLLSKEQIGKTIAGEGEALSPGAVEVHVSRLRSKLESSGLRIVYVRGMGYLLRAPGKHGAISHI